MEIVSSCVVCQTGGAVLTAAGDAMQVRCPLCTEFRITRTAIATLEPAHPIFRDRVAGSIRRHFNLQGRPIFITSEHLEVIATNDPSPTTVPDKQNALLLDVARRSRFPGSEVGYSAPDCIVVNSTEFQELEFHIWCLTERGLVHRNAAAMCTLTAPGWDEAIRLRNPTSGEKVDIFVAMAFHTDLAEAWTDGLVPGITGAGYRAKRVDSDEHNDKIDDRIMAGIRSCFAVVVDVTQQNRGAYFEAGFAIGLGRPVVWTVQNEDLKNVHFDTRQFNHVVWETPAELASKLRNRLLGVFGEGPIKPLSG